MQQAHLRAAEFLASGKERFGLFAARGRMRLLVCVTVLGVCEYFAPGAKGMTAPSITDQPNLPHKDTVTATYSEEFTQRYSHQVWNTGSGLPQDTVRQFLQTRDGFMWLATDGGLVRFDGSDFAVYDRRNTPQMQSDLVNGLAEDSDGNLWVATSNGLVRLGKDGIFVRFTTEQGLPADSILSVYNESQGKMCVQTTSGGAYRTPGGFVAGSCSGPVNMPRISRISAPDGSTWSVTATGLSRAKNGQTISVPMPEGFSGDEVLTLYVDREGNIWAGSENAGAAITRRLAFQTIGRKDGLAADQVRSLLQDGQGDLWFGTGAGLTRLHNGKLSSITTAEGLASNEIIALTGSSADDLWIGTPDGLNHLEHGRVTTRSASDELAEQGLPDNDIRSLLEAHDHSVWIGTTHGLAHLVPGNGGRIRTYTAADGLPSNVIGSLLEDPDGSLWVGTRAGLAHLQNGEIHGSLLKSTIITALGRDAGGVVWIGTSGSGLFGWQNGVLFHLTTTKQLPDTVYSILEDVRGDLWFSSMDGIYRLAGKTLRGYLKSESGALLDVTRYDVADGLRISDCSSGGHPEGIRSADGRLLFATSKGVSIVDPSELSKDAAGDGSGPPVALESIFVDDSTVSGLKSVRVPAGHDRIALHYAGIYFEAPSKVRYRYQLAPFDRNWIDAGARRTAYYTNIPPGKYVFRVEASTDGVTWSARTADVELAISPHYYQTWWFYLLMALMVILIGWQLYLYRLRQVELRFHAVLAERGRIAREIHDTLAQDIVAISVQLDLVARLLTLSVDKAREQLTATRDLVRKSLAGARSSIWDLRSQPATGSDLPTRLREVTRQVVGDAPLKLDLQITGSYRTAKVELEDELLRIAQEAVTNAVRHGEPTTIVVRLCYDTAGVELRVQDDGRGFTVSSAKAGPAGHYGIRGMHERAERAQARLRIESAPGAGTTVIADARIP
jgi:signal transduction histidine kinase/ligand-binding sensor domain-containing protein